MALSKKFDIRTKNRPFNAWPLWVMMYKLLLGGFGIMIGVGIMIIIIKTPQGYQPWDWAIYLWKYMWSTFLE